MNRIVFANIPADLDAQFRAAAPQGETKMDNVAAFRVRNTQAADKTSGPVTIKAMHFDEKTREIKVFCDDGRVRRCKVDRLPNVAVGRFLWKELALLGKNNVPVCFTAAGGFSPDVWFYDVSSAV